INSQIRRAPGIGPPIEPRISQCYNNFSHHTRRSAGHHIVQRGILTGAAAGAWAANGPAETIASKLFHRIALDLPHKALEEQVDQLDETCLRFENNFTIHCNRLEPRFLHGEEFFDFIIEPLITACSHPDVFEALRSTSTVLKPDVYPSMLLWTAYPVTVLLEEVWNRHIHPVLAKRNAPHANNPIANNPRSRRAPPMDRLALVPKPEWLELLAILERCICFAHTGNAPALAYALMKRTYTSRALLEGYLPMFWDGLEIPDHAPLLPKLLLHKWPIDNLKDPLLASKRAQSLTYGSAHLAGYLAYFKIQLRISRVLIRKGLAPNSDQINTCLQILAEVSIDAFVDDITDLVRKAVKAVKDDADLHPENHDTDWVKVRWDSFSRWEQIKQRLDYGPNHDTYTLLARALAPSEADQIHGLPQGKTKSISVGDLARSIHDICHRAELRQQIRAPVWRDGNLPAVARIAIANAHSRMGPDISNDDKAKQIVKFFTDALLNKNVHFFPNSPDDGHPIPSTDIWTFLGNRPNAVDVASNNLETIGARRMRLCDEQARHASQADVTASWSILECTLESFASYMHHVCLPDDWSYENDTAIQGNALVLQVYQWAENRLKDPTKDWCTRLALALAFLFSRLTPDRVFCPDTTKAKIYPILTAVCKDLRALRPTTRSQSIAITRKLPWIDKPNRKGTSNRAHYCTQASVVILAWIDRSSPLRKELALNKGKSELISLFNSKHTAKGLGVANMVRLGVLEAQGEAILNSPKPNQAYFARNDVALQAWETEVTGAFKRGNDSIYSLVLKIFRSEVTNHLVQSGEFPSRPVPVAPIVPPLARTKRRAEPQEVSDSEDERQRARRRR
ncbi:hypothetical protein LXA43DRAFT_908377, partial [Ganoderma leucocontextum]